MNERIKELAEQANANELSYAYYRGEKRPENAVTLHSVDLEKFAELIIKECAKVCDDLDIDDWGDKSFDDGTYYCSRAIKQHFGVEE